jgi:hypothetical protein
MYLLEDKWNELSIWHSQKINQELELMPILDIVVTIVAHHLEFI